MLAKFEISCSTFEQTLRVDGLAQVAFVGRSNAGKSSLLNMLTNQKRLAITSSTPGRTRLINFFRVSFAKDKPEIFFVDLPGYGFASAAKSAKDGWGVHITDYLTKTRALRRVFILLDIRHSPSKLDLQMLHFLQTHDMPFSIVATKADKLSRAQTAGAVKILAHSIGVGSLDIIVTSAKNRTGIDDVTSKILDILNG